MKIEKRIVSAFDFDGTITRKDTLLEFIRYTHGSSALYLGILIHLPFIIGFKLKFYSNERAKERLFAYFFKGMDYKVFCHLGAGFAARIEGLVRKKALEEIGKCRKERHAIYIVTASIPEWVTPWATKNGINQVVGTEVERDDQFKLTGRFKTPNCYGSEKVRRLLEKEPKRDTYYLFAYGDSVGDKELIDFADQGEYHKFK